jgi:UDP-3-O-[3-hydroxymyristoyl] glucosamine N-acyltransferase
MYNITKYVSSNKVLKHDFFQSIGSVTATHSDYILCYALTHKHIKQANDNPHISIVITKPELAKYVEKALIIDNEPDILYGNISNQLIKTGKIYPKMEYGIDQSAQIHPSAIVSDKTKIGKNVIIGRNTIINNFTIIEDNVIIGDNVVIGCDGFYFKRNQKKELIKFLHAGGVHLHKNVEIMTGSMIQRAHDATFTTIGEGTKVSVNVNIGHSSYIGKHNMITGNVQIAGRVKIGDYCWIGTSATISDSIEIQDNSQIKIGSVVVKHVKKDTTVSGNFAYEHQHHLKNYIKAQR